MSSCELSGAREIWWSDETCLEILFSIHHTRYTLPMTRVSREQVVTSSRKVMTSSFSSKLQIEKRRKAHREFANCGGYLCFIFLTARKDAQRLRNPWTTSWQFWCVVNPDDRFVEFLRVIMILPELSNCLGRGAFQSRKTFAGDGSGERHLAPVSQASIHRNPLVHHLSLPHFKRPLFLVAHQKLHPHLFKKRLRSTELHCAKFAGCEGSRWGPSTSNLDLVHWTEACYDTNMNT